MVSSDACVDHYAPAGIAAYVYDTQCEDIIVDPPTATIAATDGQLIIDRTTAPATYRMTGSTLWDAVVRCGNDQTEQTAHPTGGAWVDSAGTFDGQVISGGLSGGQFTPEYHDWTFTPVEAVFAVEPGVCSEPSTDQWTATSELSFGSAAVLTWTRVATEGCVDRFAPSGTATNLADFDCVTAVLDPESAPVASDDGELVIDRATDPATYRMTGRTYWPGTLTCTHADGSVETRNITFGGQWAGAGGGGFYGAFDGDRFSAHVDIGDERYEWSLTRR
jgi:hypothetical protein